MRSISRRQLLQAGLAVAAGSLGTRSAFAYVPSGDEVPLGNRPPQDPSVKVLHPRDRVPLSFIIDDSTCLVNMGAYCMPQFNSAWPQNPIYWRKWQDWPRGNPRQFCPRVRRVLHRARCSRQIQPGAHACMCWLAGPRTARLVEEAP